MQNDSFRTILVCVLAASVFEQAEAQSLVRTPSPPTSWVSRTVVVGLTAAPHELGSSPTFDAACADVDQNGIDDIVFGNITDHPNEVWLGGVSPCSGRFVAWQTLNGASAMQPNGNNTHAVLMADLDGDDFPDLVVGNNFEQNQVFLNQQNSGGSWLGFDPTPTHVFGSAAFNYTWDLAAGDLDNNGTVDIVEGRNNAQSTLIWWGNGDGSFDPTPMDLGDIGSTHGVAIGNFDGNLHADIAIANFGPNVLMLQSAGGFTPVTLASNNLTSSVAVGDLWEDASELDDILFGNTGVPNQVLLAQGAGMFLAAALGASTEPTGDVAVGDLNADGHMDLVVANTGDVDTEVWFGDGSGVFSLPTLLRFATGDTHAVAIGNLNGTGALDLVAGNRNGACGEANTLWFGE